MGMCVLYFDIEGSCLSQNNLVKFCKKRRDYENNEDVVVFHFISDERELEIKECTTQDGTLYCYYITLKKSHKIVRPYDSHQPFSSPATAAGREVHIHQEGKYKSYRVLRRK